jgi:hypothetical protein
VGAAFIKGWAWPTRGKARDGIGSVVWRVGMLRRSESAIKKSSPWVPKNTSEPCSRKEPIFVEL